MSAAPQLELVDNDLQAKADAARERLAELERLKKRAEEALESAKTAYAESRGSELEVRNQLKTSVQVREDELADAEAEVGRFRGEIKHVLDDAQRQADEAELQQVLARLPADPFKAHVAAVDAIVGHVQVALAEQRELIGQTVGGVNLARQRARELASRLGQTVDAPPVDRDRCLRTIAEHLRAKECDLTFGGDGTLKLTIRVPPAKG